MITLIVVAVLILVGLPVAAVLSSRQLPAPKQRPIKGDVFWKAGQHYGLRGTDYAMLEDAVRDGKSVPARLRPAAHAMAVEMLRQEDRFGLPRSYKRVMLLVLVITTSLAVIGLVVHHSVAPIAALLWSVPYGYMVARYQRPQLAATERAKQLTRPPRKVSVDCGDNTTRRAATSVARAFQGAPRAQDRPPDISRLGLRVAGHGSRSAPVGVRLSLRPRGGEPLTHLLQRLLPTRRTGADGSLPRWLNVTSCRRSRVALARVAFPGASSSRLATVDPRSGVSGGINGSADPLAGRPYCASPSSVDHGLATFWLVERIS